MRILFFDIDTLRADHLGCYGYGRSTSPVIDSLARESVCFDQYYCPNAPCLPSRASMVTGRYGIHTGIVGHGGTAADLRLQGENRHFTDDASENSLFMNFRRAGLRTVSFSTFAERHSAWWFNSGFHECYNVGLRGGESAEMVTPRVLEWLRANGTQDNWALHIHFWDPHTPYRTPPSYQNPFENEPLCDGWITPEVFAEHRRHIGPHGAHEINMWNDDTFAQWPLHPGTLETVEDAKHFIDLYDGSVRYTDENIGAILDCVRALGVYEDMAVIVTSDHGEDLGEFGIYGEHGMADECVGRIPLLIRWPGARRGARVAGFFDNTCLAPTLQELLGTQMFGEAYRYDGTSFADALFRDDVRGADSVILTQCAHVCQRAARFGHYIYIRTQHGGYHLLPRELLFDLDSDPHQQHDLAAERPELCAYGAKLILDWTDRMMRTAQSDADPMWTVLREGGPEHCRGHFAEYCRRLEATGRAFGVPLLREQYPDDLR